MTTHRRSGAPSSSAVWANARAKGSVTTAATGMPRLSRATASCTLHDVHEPQSPIAVTTAAASRFKRSYVSGGAGCENSRFRA